MSRRDWLAWFIGGTLVIALAGAAHLAADIGQPFPGFIVFRNIPQNRWYYDRITPSWWTGVTDTQLANQPEALIALDGEPFGANQRELYNQAYARGERTVTFQVDNWELGAVLERQAPLLALTTGDLLDYRLSDFIVFITLWLLALMLYRVQPRDRSARIAAVLFCVIGEYRWLDHHTVFMDDQVLTRALGVLGYCFYGPSIGAVLLHFALRFPRPSRWLQPAALAVNYGLACVWMGGRLLAQFIWPIPMGVDWHAIDTWLLRGAAVHVVVAFIATIARMGWVWWRFRKQPSVARPASHFAAGLLAATPAVFIYIDLALRGGDARPEYYAAGLDLRYLLIAIPLSIAFTILRYRAFRSTHPLLVLVFVIATSALLASLGTWLWGLAIDVNDRNAPPPFVPLFLVALVTGSLWSSQMQWRGALGRVFHWQERGFNELRAYADSLSGQADTAGLARRITTGLVDRFGCECAALWIWHPDVEALALTQAAGEWPDPLPQQAAFGLEQLRTVIQPRHLTGRVHDGFLDQLNANGCVVAAGLWDSLNDRPLGLLGIGKRKDDEVFDEHDLEILALSAHQAAAMLLAMRQIETLRGVPQRLLEAQQQERFRIAQDLHDTVQQRLGGVQPLLSAVRLYLQRDLSRADQLLSESAAGIETAAQMVSRIRHDLAPPELAGSLAQALSGALEQFRARTGIEASLTIDADLDHRLSPEARQALWMIVHQALDNVAEHAGAARVTVSLTGAADALTFEIRDTGRGFSPAGLQAARNAGSFGLTSMRARANALGGELVVTSVEGAGTCVSGRLPYARRDDGAGPTTMRIPDDGPTSRP